VPRDLRKKCKFHLAKDLQDVLKHALVNDPIEWAKQLKREHDEEIHMQQRHAARAAERAAS